MSKHARDSVWLVDMFSLRQKVVNRLGSFKTPLLIKSLKTSLQYFQLLITKFPTFSMDLKTLLDNLHDEVSCSVCMCTYTDPKQLPCLHSFCLQCLNGIQRTSGLHGKITCPECRKQFKISGSGDPSELPTIFVSIVWSMSWQLKSAVQLTWNAETARKGAPRLFIPSSVVLSGARNVF